MMMCLSNSQDDDSRMMCLSNSQDDDSKMMCLSNSQDDSKMMCVCQTHKVMIACPDVSVKLTR